MRQPSRQRLDFQGQAATIQTEASRLILRTTELFGWVFEHGVLPHTASEETSALAEMGISLADEWRDLRPTRSLEPLWRQLATQFDELSRLFAEVATLNGLSGEALLTRVRTLQTAFTEHVDHMNQAETLLLEHEVHLRGRADDGLDDE